MVDAHSLKQSFAEVGGNGDQVPLYFYSYLFLTHPEVRELFPLSMARQRDKLVTALGRIVSNVDRLDELVPMLRHLGADHRKFAVIADHYPAVGEALLATLAHFLGDRWTPQLATEWEAAYGIIAKVMIEAAEEAALTAPPWWEAEVVAHERRGFDIAVFQVRPNYRLDFEPGQSVGVETDLAPKLWRYLSPANAPRPDGTLEFHVRVVDGGAVSTALVHHLQVGDVVRLGSPVGTALRLAAADPQRDLLLLAGGTGLAPLRSITEHALTHPDGNPGRRIHLVVGARRASELYDLAALTSLAQAAPRLTVTPTVSHDLFYPGEKGNAVDVALRTGRWQEHEVFVCGSAGMISGTMERLTQAGVPADRIHVEDFDADAYAPLSAPPDETRPPTEEVPAVNQRSWALS